MEKEQIKYNTPSNYSRFSTYEAYKDDTNIFFEIPKYIEIPESPDDMFFMVTQKYEDRIDLISALHYNNVIMWWIIAKANHLTNPMCIPIDTILRIPSIDHLFGLGGTLPRV